MARNISKTLDTRCRELLALSAAMLEQAKAEQWDSLENALAKRQALLELTTAELLEEAQEVEHYRTTLQKVKDFNAQIETLANKQKETVRRDLLAVNKTSKAAKSYQQSAATDD